MAKRHIYLDSILPAPGHADHEPRRHRVRVPAAKLIHFDHAQLPNLHVTLLNAVGVPVEKVGDSTGKLTLEPLAGV